MWPSTLNPNAIPLPTVVNNHINDLQAFRCRAAGVSLLMTSSMTGNFMQNVSISMGNEEL